MTYFAAWCLFVSTAAVISVPTVGFRLPSNIVEWGYLIVLGLCGFIMQFLLTAGLAHEKSSRATNMVYTQILFALAFDKIVFNTTPDGWSLAGSSLVLGSAMFIAVHKEKVKNNTQSDPDGEGEGTVLLAESEGINEDSAGLSRSRLRGAHDIELRASRAQLQ